MNTWERVRGRKRWEWKKSNHLNFGRGRGLHEGRRKGTSRIIDGKPARNSQEERNYELYQALLRGHPVYFFHDNSVIQTSASMSLYSLIHSFILTNIY